MALGGLHSRFETPIVAMWSITVLVYCMRRGIATVIFGCAKKIATAGYPNPVQFHGSLNLSSSLRYSVHEHLMKKPISIPTSIQVIISVLISCVQISSKWGTVPCGVVDPPCMMISHPSRPRARQTHRWLWEQSSPCQCAVNVAQDEGDDDRRNEYARYDVNQVHIKYIYKNR